MNAKILNILFTSVILIYGFSAKCQTISNERRVDWEAAINSYDLIIPQSEVNVKDFGALGDGLNDDSQAIQDAINSSSSLKFVYFPPGEYLLKSPISIPDSTILNADASKQASLIFHLNGLATNCINISSGQSEDYDTIVEGYEFKSSKLILASNNFNPGDYAEIVEDNGEWDITPADWAQNTTGQILRITEVNADTIIFENPLRIEYDEELFPRIRKIYPLSNSGIECLKIKRIDDVPEGAGSNISLNYAANCMIAGIESDSSVGSHISIYNSTNILISGNYIHGGYTYDGSGTRGYGIMLSNHSGECLIENNILRHLRHAMMVKAGANGNVFAYNYSLEPVRTEPINDLSGDISLHGHFAFSNLFEGNIVQNIIIDHYWGPSGPWNTFNRNRAELYGFLMTENDVYETSYLNIVGNECSNMQFPYGQFILTGEEQFIYGNNIQNNTIPEDTDDYSDNSYFLDEAPDYWTENLPWPPIGYPNQLGEFLNPAKKRFLDGDIFTVCPDEITEVFTNPEKTEQIKIYPNPATDFVSIEVGLKYFDLEILNLNGKTLIKKPNCANNLRVKLNNYKPGIYFVKIISKNQTYFKKLIIK